MAVKILSKEESAKVMAEFLATTRYSPEEEIPRDEHGMPVVAPEPDDPDDE